MMAEPTQDGMTPDEWLEAQFEFEYCDCCGLGAEDHTVITGPFGLFFAYCHSDPEVIGEEAYRSRYLEVRKEEAPSA